MPKEIEIIIDKNGNFQIEAQGFKGSACEKALKDVLKDSGAKVVTDRKTREFYEHEEESEKEQQ